MGHDAQFWIRTLNLDPHPEGGYYRETYRAAGRTTEDRAHSTAIYYLLSSGDTSTLHRLRSDEVFHHYTGSVLTVHVIHPGGEYQRIELGEAPERGTEFQAVVPAGSWFGATVEQPGSFALVGCTVAPGFEFKDFEQAERATLVHRYPAHRALIERLTRPLESPRG